MGLVMRDRGRDMRDRGEGPRPLRCLTRGAAFLRRSTPDADIRHYIHN